MGWQGIRTRAATFAGNSGGCLPADSQPWSDHAAVMQPSGWRKPGFEAGMKIALPCGACPASGR